MTLKQLSEIAYRMYNEGRVKATNQNFKQADITQMCTVAAANIFRQLYYSNKKLKEGEEYYFYSPLLSVNRFDLTDANIQGMRRASMKGFDLYRLPKNAHFTNVYPVGTGCKGNENMEVTQVSPGEENFYLSPEFTFFMFYVVKGVGINTYHLPPCITSVDVETTYNSDEADISMDVAFDAIQQVLGTTLRIPGFYNKTQDNPYQSPQLAQLRRAVQQPEQPQV